MNHIEHRLMHRPIELDPGNPFFDPADPALQCLDTGQRHPDGVACRHPDGQFDPAAFWRKIEQIDAPAMLASATEVDVHAKWNPFRPASMALHGRLPVNPSCIETILNRPISEALSSGADREILDWLVAAETLAFRHVAIRN